MGQREYNELAYTVLTLLQAIAPDAKAQDKLIRAHNDYESGKERAIAMVGILYDGLAYGNWLWDLPTLADSIKE